MVTKYLSVLLVFAFTACGNAQQIPMAEAHNSTQMLYSSGPIAGASYQGPVGIPIATYGMLADASQSCQGKNCDLSYLPSTLARSTQSANQTDTQPPSAPASSPTPVTPAVSPLQVILFSGATYNGGGNPRAGMNVGALYQFSKMIYGGLVADVGFNKSPQTNIRGEMVVKVADINGIPIFTLVDVGGAFAASNPSAIVSGSGSALAAVVSNVGTNIGYSAASGLATAFPFPLYKKLYVMPSIRAVKGSLNDMQYVIGINFGAPVTIKKE